MATLAAFLNVQNSSRGLVWPHGYVDVYSIHILGGGDGLMCDT